MGGLWENKRLVVAFTKKFPDVRYFISSPSELGEKILAKMQKVQFMRLLQPACIISITN